MTDELKHECAVAMVVLRKPPSATGDFGGTKLSLLLEKQHNRGQDGAGAAILSSNPEPGETPYWIAKSASSTPLADVLGMIGKRQKTSDFGLQTSVAEVRSPKSGVERIFLGHLRYATFGKNDVAFCHPFVHESSDLAHTLLLAGNFNLTNAHELFDDYRHHGAFPTSKSDGYLICELIAKGLQAEGHRTSDIGLQDSDESTSQKPEAKNHIATAIGSALANADGAWTLCGMTADGWAFATRDPHGIRPGWHYIDDNVVVVASERAAIQAAFDVPPEAVKELPPGEALVVSPEGEVKFCGLDIRQPTAGSAASDPNNQTIPVPRPCSFERIYFSRANDADIHRERKALGAALVPRILEAADAPMDRIFFSYIPNSARIAFHGLLEELFKQVVAQRRRDAESVLSLGRCPRPQESCTSCQSCPKTLRVSASLREISLPRFGEVAVKDAKFRTFIADAAARREFYKHVYDVTYGLVKKDDTLVVLDDSIVRGNTMKNAILPMLDRLGPKRIVIASSAPPIRYPDCYGIDMSTLGELVAFRALVNLLDGERGTGNGERLARRSLGEGGGTGNGERELREALAKSELLHVSTCSTRLKSLNPLASLYARFTEKQHAAEIARLLIPPGMKAEVVVVYQSIEDLHKALAPVPHSPFPVPHIICYDFGVKTNILRSLASWAKVTVVPAKTPAEEVLAMNPDGVFLSNGPADPAAVSYAIENIQKMLGIKPFSTGFTGLTGLGKSSNLVNLVNPVKKLPIPIMGICLGHQLLSLACGAKTGRLKFGHHGCNHPVKNLATGKVEITSQNHNFAVLPESVPDCLEVTHINLNDGSIEGVRHKTLPAFSVQYHPESCPGPHDSKYLFDEFRKMIMNHETH